VYSHWLQAELDTRAEQVAALTNQLQSLQAQVCNHHCVLIRALRCSPGCCTFVTLV
jgi:hypothetical protein